VRPNQIFAATNSGLFETNDQGVSWTRKGNGLLDTVVWDSTVYAIAYDTAGYLYAEKSSGIYRSGNGGNNWQLVNAALPGPPTCLYVTSNGNLLGGFGLNIFRSTDQGLTWAPMTSSINSDVNQIISIPNGMLLAATLLDGVHLSADNGQTWSPANSGLTSLSVYSLAFTSDGYFWAGTAGGGVFRGTIKSFGVKENKNTNTTFTAYPNPAPGKFFIDAKENATLEVYDPSGRLLQATPVASGSKNEIFLNEVRSGFYFLRLISKEHVETGNIMVVR